MLEAEGHPIALNALARRAGVGVGTVYRHFRNSQELLEALAFDALRELEAEIRAAAAEPDAWTGLERVVHAQVRLEVAHVGMREVLATASSDDATAAAKAEMATLVDDIVQRTWAAGQLHVRITAHDLRNMLCGVGYAAAITPDRAAQTAQQHARILLRGLRRQPD
jgi:AcrR family transcriptional regulator